MHIPLGTSRHIYQLEESGHLYSRYSSQEIQHMQELVAGVAVLASLEGPGIGHADYGLQERKEVVY